MQCDLGPTAPRHLDLSGHAQEAAQGLHRAVLGLGAAGVA